MSLNFYAINTEAAAAESTDWVKEEKRLRKLEEQEDAEAIEWGKKSEERYHRSLIADAVDPNPCGPTRGFGYVLPKVLGIRISRPSSLVRAMIMNDSNCNHDFGKYSIQLHPEGMAQVTVNGVMTRYEFNPVTYEMTHTPMNLGGFLNMLGTRHQK